MICCFNFNLQGRVSQDHKRESIINQSLNHSWLTNQQISVSPSTELEVEGKFFTHALQEMLVTNQTSAVNLNIKQLLSTQAGVVLGLYAAAQTTP